MTMYYAPQVGLTLANMLDAEHPENKMTYDAILAAIAEHGSDAEAQFVGGQPSHRKGSRCKNLADKSGWTKYALYSGQHIPSYFGGILNVMVKIQ